MSWNGGHPARLRKGATLSAKHSCLHRGGLRRNREVLLFWAWLRLGKSSSWVSFPRDLRLPMDAFEAPQPATRAELSRLAGREISRDVIGALKRHGPARCSSDSTERGSRRPRLSSIPGRSPNAGKCVSLELAAYSPSRGRVPPVCPAPARGSVWISAARRMPIRSGCCRCSAAREMSRDKTLGRSKSSSMKRRSKSPSRSRRNSPPICAAQAATTFASSG